MRVSQDVKQHWSKAIIRNGNTHSHRASHARTSAYFPFPCLPSIPRSFSLNRRRLSFHCWRSVIWKLYSCKTRQRASGNGYFEIYCNIRGGPDLPLVNKYKSKLGASTGCLLMIVHVIASTLVRRIDRDHHYIC